MNGEVATFMLSSFDEFVTSYKANNNALASEAVEAFNHFLPTLDKFFNLLDEFKEMMMHLIYSLSGIVLQKFPVMIPFGQILIGINKQFLTTFRLT